MPSQQRPHHRQSLRLRNYDYAKPGAYFVTICVQDRLNLFGSVVGAKTALNDAGLMIVRWWNELANKFPSIELDAFVSMPDHVHGIIRVHALPEIELHPTLGAIVGWYKTMTTNDYICGVKQLGWTPFAGRLWQRNYWDRVVRDEAALHRIREYIVNNPRLWSAKHQATT